LRVLAAIVKPIPESNLPQPAQPAFNDDLDDGWLALIILPATPWPMTGSDLRS
jgi:hypothetical protein